jgi:hypothetical protein
MPKKNPTSEIPDGHFLNTDGPIPLVVEHATGEPKFAVVKGRHVPHDEFKADLAGHYAEAGEDLPDPKEFAITSSQSPPSAEEMAAMIEAEEEALALLSLRDDADLYFVHAVPRQPALVVEHATGEPRFKIEDGELVPLEGIGR